MNNVRRAAYPRDSITTNGRNDIPEIVTRTGGGREGAKKVTPVQIFRHNTCLPKKNTVVLQLLYMGTTDIVIILYRV